MLKRTLWSLCFLALLCALPPARVEAAGISAGTFITITADTFAVPIQITDGVEVTGWSFGLSYKPSDWTINTGCDPFTDTYCGLDNGPITEGAFFSSGAPFNVLCCGVIELDGSLNQTGNLFGVKGLFGGSPPYPSGDGILAYVEFINVLGAEGDSKINVTDPSVTSAVPEPTTLALLAIGLLAFGVRRKPALAWRIAT